MTRTTTDAERFRYLPEPPCLILVDKPVGMTSTNVVSVVKRLLNTKRTGHGGTLDPFATGLLPVMVGREVTRQAEELLSGDKEYVMTVRFGAETDSSDLMGKITAVREGPIPDREAIEAVFSDFVGEIMQESPIFSALKYGGKPMYWYARRGIPVSRPPRQVRIDSLEFIEMLGPDVVIAVRCGKGVYMRSLGHDIGRAVGCPAHLIALRRTVVGPHRVEDAWPVWRLKQAIRRPEVEL